MGNLGKKIRAVSAQLQRAATVEECDKILDKLIQIANELDAAGSERNAVLEEAARCCEAHIYSPIGEPFMQHCADNIRALKNAAPSGSPQYAKDHGIGRAVDSESAPAHTDHPLRHWDRTCPACIAESASDKAAYGNDDGHCQPAAPFEDALAFLRRKLQLDENGDDSGIDPGLKPRDVWEMGYCAGVRCTYRVLRDAAPAKEQG